MSIKKALITIISIILFNVLFADEIHVVQRGDTLLRLAAQYGVSVNEIRELNRLSNDQIRIGQRLIIRRSVAQTPIHHTVRAGDNLTAIARQHNTTVAQIQEWNNLQSSTIHANQRLIVGFQTPANQKPRFHMVQSGETLSAISRRYDIAVLDLIEFNKLSGFTIFPGQRIWLEDGHVTDTRAVQPTATPTRDTSTPIPATHTVRRGENLFRIALQYNIALDDLRRWNRLANDNIRVGQVLRLRDTTEAPRPTQEATRPRTPPVSELPRSVLPVSNVNILSEFGMRGGRMHKGIDFGGNPGAPIFAVLPGTVRFSGVQRGYGNMVIIEHENNIMTVYAHNESNLVTEGQQVTQGQIIATIGRTGNTTVHHVHFEFRVNNSARNPRELLRL